MGIHTIKMPDIGEGIAEVELVAWRVQPGEQVTPDQILADVMTDKATVEIPSPVAGTVLELGGGIGETLAVGAPLIQIEVEGEGNARPKASAAVQRAEAAATQSAGERSAAPAPAPSAVPMRAPAPRPSTPATPALSMPARAAAAVPASSKGPAGQRSNHPIASPALRRRAWELGIDLADVPATGLAGRIMEQDLDAYAASHPTKLRPARRAQPDTAAAQDHQETVRIIGLRRKIAQKMQESKRRIPHFTYVEEIDVTELEALRARLNSQWAVERGHLTMLPLLVRAIVLAVRDFPQMNARFDDDVGVVTRHSAVHLGIATQTEFGLMVPVLRHAQSRDLWDNAAAIAQLAEAARSGRATRDELSGSTLTITSLGALGGIVSTPVINHPEVAIVGVNRIVLRPTMQGGAVVPRQIMNLSSSFDHRVVDGLHAAQFIQAVRGFLEAPATLFID